jgi:hypothetical protein
MIEYKIPLWAIIMFSGAQLAAFAWFLIQLHFANKENKERLDEVEKENAETKKELKEVRETLLIVKHNTELLMLGLLKTGAKNQGY